MYPIYFITTNNGKITSMRKWVEPLGIKVIKYRKKINIPERKLSSVEEVASFKAMDICKIVEKPFVVQDSGFYLDAIPGYPGPDVNRVLSTIGISGLINLIPKEENKRNCYFEEVLVFWSPSLKDLNKPVVFKAKIRGTLALTPTENNRKEAWSSLWTVFVPNGFNSTLATMNKEEQDRYASEVRSSPESNCFIGFAEWLKQNIHYLYVQERMDELFYKPRVKKQ
jgi:XTP/dITP diphosphohydrolase